MTDPRLDQDRSHAEAKETQAKAIPLPKPIDIPARLREIARIQAGWLDGQGLEPDRAGLKWLAARFAAYPDGCPTPYLFPTVRGGVQAEWDVGDWSVSLDIDLASHTADWHAWTMDDDSDVERHLDLDTDDAWAWITKQFTSIGAA